MGGPVAGGRPAEEPPASRRRPVHPLPSALAGVAVAAIAWVGPVARAAPCEPLDAIGFRQLVAEAGEAIVRDDPDEHARISEALFARLPCLVVVPDPHDWATFLAGHAAVAYLRREEWQAPLAAAIAADPDVDRGVGPDHEIARWTPPPPPPGVGSVPEGSILYLDGVRTTELPAPVGWHLAQLVVDGSMSSALLRDQDVPAFWWPPPPPQPPPPPAPPPAPRGARRWLVHADVAAGGAAWAQRVDSPGDFAADERAAAGEVGAAAGLGVGGRPGGRPWFGGSAEILATSGPRLDAALALALGIGRASLGGGGALATATRVEGGSERRSAHVVPIGALAAGWGPLDLALDGGWAPYLTRGRARVGLTVGGHRADLPDDRRLRYRLGLEGRLTSAAYVQSAASGSERTLVAVDHVLLGQIGVAWGSW